MKTKETKTPVRVFISFTKEVKTEETIIKKWLEEVASNKERIPNGLKIITQDEGDEMCGGNFVDWMVKKIPTCQILISLIGKEANDETNHKWLKDELEFARDKGLQILPIIVGDFELSKHIGNALRCLSQAKIECSDFDTIKEKVIFNFLDMYNKVINGIKNVTIDELPLKSFSENSSFVGRKMELNQIENILNTNNENVVILKGDGGIGKTALAKQYFYEHKEEFSRHYILDASGGIVTAICSIDFPETSFIKNQEEKFLKNIRCLHNCSSRLFIILDNCDEKIERLEELSSNGMACRFIVTSRCGVDNNKNTVLVNKMDDESLSLFIKNNISKNNRRLETFINLEEGINKLIKETEGHTLTIELASAILGRDSTYNFDSILDVILNDKNEISTEHSAGKKETIFRQLSNLYNISKLTNTEKNILKVMSIVSPEIGIKKTLLKELLNLESYNEIYNLIDLTIIKQEDDNLRLHSVLSDVIYKNELVSNSYEIVKPYLLYLNENEFEDINERCVSLSFIYNKRLDVYSEDKSRYELILTLAILSNDFLGRYELSLMYTEEINRQYAKYKDLYFYFHYINLLIILEKYDEVIKIFFIEINDYYCSDFYYSYKQQIEKVYNFYKKINKREVGFDFAIKAVNTLLKKTNCDDFDKRMHCYELLKRVYNDDMNTKKAEYYSKILEEYKSKINNKEDDLNSTAKEKENIDERKLKQDIKLFYKNHQYNELMSTYSKYALYLNNKNKFLKALKYYEKLVKLSISLNGNKNSIDLVDVYYIIGRIYYNKKKHNKALKNFISALFILEEQIISFENDGIEINTQKRILNDAICNEYIFLKKYDKAYEIAFNELKSIESKFSANPNHNEISNYFTKIGIILYHQSKYNEALKYFLKAYNNYKNINDNYINPNIYSDIIACLLKLKNINECKSFVDEIWNKINMYNPEYYDEAIRDIAILYNNIALFYLKIKYYHIGKDCCNVALHYFFKILNIKGIMRCIRRLILFTLLIPFSKD